VNIDEQYVEGLYPNDPELEAIEASIAEAGMPSISVAGGYGRLLSMLVRMSGAKRALEIGALGGYSGLCITRGLPANGELLSLELLPAYAELAKQNMEKAGYGGNVSYAIGDAKESLKQLVEKGERFQFFFIDADKEGYPAYLEYALKLADSGALIVADNILLRGRTTNFDKKGPAVLAVRSFNEQFATDPRLESTILPGYDGLAIARVK